MTKVYFISGLGADKRVFSFLDLSFCEPVYMDWIKPMPKESLEQYALRLREYIPEKSPVIVGLSFGGMLATEMAKADKNVSAIIIGSNKTADEFPRYLRIGKYIPVYKWVPVSLSKRVVLLFKSVLGRKNPEQTKIVVQIIRDTDPDFSKWAIEAILHWKNKEVPPNLTHIHGTRDKLLPYRLVKAHHTVDGGPHVLPLHNPQEISCLLKKLIF
jgi:pimeloyl-ACP methyl ester carboxylesterase